MSRSDKWLRHYDLQLVDSVDQGGHTIYTIDAVPKDDAPVVWGKEQMVIREEYVLIALVFYDQEMVPVKKMETLEIGELGGRTMATRMRMLEMETPDEYTELIYGEMDFDVQLEDRMFTVFALQSGRD